MGFRNNGVRMRAVTMMCGLALLPACKQASASATEPPASPEVIRYAAWLAPKMADSRTANYGGGVIRPIHDDSVRFRAEGGTVVMAFMADEMGPGPDALQAEQAQQAMTGQVCRMDEVHDFVAKGGVFRMEIDLKDGRVVPIGTVDHCA